MLIRSGALDVVVIDSVAALVPRAEIEGEMGDTHVGLQARLMSQALRKLAGNINRSRHDRRLHQPDSGEDRRDVRQSRRPLRADGPSSSTPRVRIDIRRIEAIKDGTGERRQPGPRQGGQEQGGTTVPVWPSSTSCSGRASPEKAACWTWRSSKGSCKKSGAWYTYDGDQLGQGRENAKRFLRENPEIADATAGQGARGRWSGAGCESDEASIEERPMKLRWHRESEAPTPSDGRQADEDGSDG